MDVKGKGQMRTYYLVGERAAATPSPDSDHRMVEPGASDPVP
jgi:hypothetical protein